MQLQNKNILLISPEPWDYLFVSKHHYAIYLGKRSNKVFFLNPPSACDSVIQTEYENVFVVNYRGFPKGLRFYPLSLKKHFTRKKFNQLQRQCGVTIDIVWSFDNSVFFDFSALPKNVLKICHIVDSNQDFQFREAASTADYCFCVTEFLRSKLSAYNQKVFKINHGYAQPDGLSSDSLSLPGQNLIKVMYTGNLDIPYIDWNLVHILVSENANVDFCFAGAKSNANKQVLNLSAFDNFHYMGKLNKNDLNHYIKLADIMLLVYRADEFREQLANSHKIMEYMASGKVLVATYTDELQSLRDEQLICMSNTNAELPLLFSIVLKNLSTWNASEKSERRKKWALDNTYDKQIERIELLISKIEGDHERNVSHL